jgi:hypothetical protein
MLDAATKLDVKDAAPKTADSAPKMADLPLWEQPKLEEVSEQVMAQPYIRFT